MSESICKSDDNIKPVWNELYSVAASTWNHFVWVDLSLLFDCPSGIKLKSALIKDSVVLVDLDYKDENGRGELIIMQGIEDKWLEWQSKATAYCQLYNRWQKEYGKN